MCESAWSSSWGCDVQVGLVIEELMGCGNNMGTRNSEVELDIGSLEPCEKECDKKPGVLGCTSTLASECDNEPG
eukprot:4131134-Prorocentrum_lima.AAC.1